MKDILLKQFKEYEQKLNMYSFAYGTISFDAQTGAPKKSYEYRGKMLSLLIKDMLDYQTNPNNIKMLQELSKQDLDYETKRNVELHLIDLEFSLKVPITEYTKFIELRNESSHIWEEAKETKNYELFAPHLKNMIEYTKIFIEYRGYEKHPYNLLLNDYEEGMNIEKYDEFFNLIKEKLVPLIKKINDKEKINDTFLSKSYHTDTQRLFIKQLVNYLHYDLNRGLVRESVHPFSSSLSTDDCRVTVNYHENMLQSAIFSIIHEIGHATYEQQTEKKYEGTKIQGAKSSGMHESQSRLYENMLGRKKEFWAVNYPILQNYFPNQLKDVTIDQFVASINKSECSFIRIEADELTYPLHILIRYEIEKELFSDKEIDYKNLNKLWSQKYYEYLGVTPRDDEEGILQDVHWSEALFGYFPTYALGSAYAAQIYNAMSKDINIEEALSNNKMSIINNWLKEHIHKDAALYKPNEIIEIATGEPFNPNYYVDYLVDKYSKLYNI